jgi:hypothetical protein
MAEMIYKKRITYGPSNQLVQMDMPYCGDCGKIVFDCQQKYCCWCGGKFEPVEPEGGKGNG